MPNHVANEIIFQGLTDDQIAHVKRSCLKPDGEFSFSVLLPPPLNSWPFSVGSKHDVFPFNDLDWCSQNWSTKWDAYGTPAIKDIYGGLAISFRTAWRPPRGWVLALFNTVKVGFVHCWLSEGDDRAFRETWDAGQSDSLAGEVWKSIESPEDLRRMYLMLWGNLDGLDNKGSDDAEA